MAIATIAAIATVVGTIGSMYYQGKQMDAQKKAMKLQQQSNDNVARRQRRQAMRQAAIKRAQIQMQGEGQGAGQSSAVKGAVSGIMTQAGGMLGFSTMQQDIGGKITDARIAGVNAGGMSQLMGGIADFSSNFASWGGDRENSRQPATFV
jgi:hypothetical protein